MIREYFKYCLFLLVPSLSVISCGENEKTFGSKNISVSEVLGSESDSGFKKAVEKIKFKFPEDNGSHPEFRTEWWYFTGNLETKQGRKFGYQFTIFRTALSPEKTERNSGWSSNQVYMGHLTVTDIDRGEFYYSEKLSRDGNELAGAAASPFIVWIEDWEVSETSAKQYYRPSEGPSKFNDFPDVKISAESDNYGIELFLKPEKKIILQGDEGLSMKSGDNGNASYYYSLTRIRTEGKLKIQNEEFEVKGFSWLDREWSTSALNAGQKGWDWFSLQLENGFELMYYQMRKKDGSVDNFSKGAIINMQSEKKNLFFKDVLLEITGYWTNDIGIKYPSGWKLVIPSENIELVITPAVKNQELKVSVRYWEGSVFIEGKFGNDKVKGRGYVELTGYEEKSQ